MSINNVIDIEIPSIKKEVKTISVVLIPILNS